MRQPIKHIAISPELHHFISLRKTHNKMTFEAYLTMITREEASKKPVYCGCEAPLESNNELYRCSTCKGRIIQEVKNHDRTYSNMD